MKTDIDQAKARSHTYRFLSQLYLRGPVPELKPYIEAVPDLARGLEKGLMDRGSASTSDPDELAADYYQIFGLNVLPFESSFLEPQNMLDGAVTEGVRAAYWAAGYSADTTRVSADHIGLELAFMADLCQTEAEAYEDRRIGIAGHLVSRQAQFFERHLLRWAPGFTQAVREQNMPFYTALVELTLDLIIDHFRSISQHVVPSTGQGSPPFHLPELPDLFADEQTGLKDIARYFLTPAYSGVYLSRDIISRFAKRLELPRGFGDRETMLTNLFRNAADYELFAALVADMQRLLERWLDFYNQLPQRGNNTALFTPFIDPWKERLKGSQRVLAKIAASIPES